MCLVSGNGERGYVWPQVMTDQGGVGTAPQRDNGVKRMKVEAGKYYKIRGGLACLLLRSLGGVMTDTPNIVSLVGRLKSEADEYAQMGAERLHNPNSPVARGAAKAEKLLHEAADTIEALQAEIDELEKQYSDLLSQASEDATQTARLREVLGFYADEATWQPRGHPQIDADNTLIQSDHGDRAREPEQEKKDG